MIISRDTWNIGNSITASVMTAVQSMAAPSGTFTQATIPTLNGGIPLTIGGGGTGSFGNSSSIPTFEIGSDGGVTIGSANVVATINAAAYFVDSVTNTSIVLAGTANAVKTAYDAATAAFTNAAARADSAYTNAIAYSGNAAQAYTNAVAYANTNAAFRGVAQTISAVWTYSANILPSTNTVNFGNTTQRWIVVGNTGDFSGAVTALSLTGSIDASNVTSGTLPEARLTHANATTNGIMQVLDSVTNTSIIIAAAANSVKLAYDTAVAANTYADSIAGTAYANAVAYANTNAAFRLVAQTISGAWTFSGNIATSANITATTNTAAVQIGNTIGRVLLFANSGDFSGAVGITGLATLATLNVTSTSEYRGISTAYANIIPSSNAMYLGGSAARWSVYANTGDFSQNVYIAGNLTVVGNLTVSGTTTQFDATTVTVDDPIITLGGDIAPVADDNKDRGVEFRWHTGAAAKTGFFGYDDSAGEFTFIPDGTNTSEVYAGTAGNVNFTKATLSTVVTSTLNVSSLSSLTTANITGILELRGNTTLFANVTATTNTAAVQIGNTIGRVLVYANTIDASGLITGSAGASITGTTNSSTGFGSGTIGASSNGLFANSTTISLGNTSVNVAVTVTGLTVAGSTVWHAGNDGSGSGLDADLLDGVNLGTSGNAIMRWDQTGTVSGVFTHSSNVVPSANSTNLGNTIARWIIVGNTLDLSSTLNVTGLSTLATANITGTQEARGNTTLFANVTATSNAAAIQIGNTIGRVLVYANTIDIGYTFGNGLIDGTSQVGLVLTSTSYFDLGSGSITQMKFVGTGGGATNTYSDTIVFQVISTSNTTGATSFYPSSNSAAAALGSTASRWLLYANAISVSGDITPISNSAAIQVGNTSRRVIVYANTIGVTGLSTLTSIDVSSNADFSGVCAFSANTRPTTNGISLGVASQRWNLSATAGDFNGAVSIDGVLTLTTANLKLASDAYYTAIPDGSANSLGLRNRIPNNKNAAYTFAKADNGQMFRLVSGAARAYTIANNSTTAYDPGTVFYVRNVQANNITITRGSGVTLRANSSATNADIVISQWQTGTIYNEATDTWVCLVQ